jgi:hypothetical protein
MHIRNAGESLPRRLLPRGSRRLRRRWTHSDNKRRTNTCSPTVWFPSLPLPAAAATASWNASSRRSPSPAHRYRTLYYNTPFGQHAIAPHVGYSSLSKRGFRPSRTLWTHTWPTQQSQTQSPRRGLGLAFRTATRPIRTAVCSFPPASTARLPYPSLPTRPFTAGSPTLPLS